MKQLMPVPLSLPFFSRFLLWFVAYNAGLFTYYLILFQLTEAFADVQSILRGISSNIAVIMVLAAISALRNELGWVVLFLWACLLAGDAEHIISEAAHLPFDQWQEGLSHTFILGSALSLTVFTKLLLVMVVGISAYYFASRTISKLNSRTVSIILLTVPLLVLPLALFSANEKYESIAYGVVEFNAQQLFSFNNIKKRKRFYYPLQDLSGESFTKSVFTKPNILLVNVEGLTEAMVNDRVMPWLAGMRSNAVHSPQFAVLNNKTTNGLYSLHCGRHSFYIRKSKIVPLIKKIRKKPWRKNKCLPGYLRENGYQTAYLQSTTLKFASGKDYMARMGFETIKGSRQLRGKEGPWGIMDGVLYENALSEIDELKRSGTPWFLSLMTSSTHHPYYFPGKKFSHDKKLDSYRYADESLAFLYEKLGEKGILKNTLVIITTDESRADNNATLSDPSSFLTTNRGFFLAFTPGKDTYSNHSLFTQADIPITILDYVGMDPVHFRGRSVFRRYFSDRRMVMAHTSKQRLLMQDHTGEVSVCYLRRKFKCYTYRYPDWNLFDIHSPVQAVAGQR